MMRFALALVLLAAMQKAALAASLRPLQIVAFGTSLTSGQTWPDAVARRLQTCLGREVRAAIIARSGATSEWGRQNVDRVVALSPDVVFVEFAVNDAALNKWVSRERSLQNIDLILQRLLSAQPRPRVFVVRMNPAWGWRGWMRLRRDDIERAHADIGVGLGAAGIDTTSAWSALAPDSVRKRMPDGLHPDSALAAEVLAPVLAQAVGGRACFE